LLARGGLMASFSMRDSPRLDVERELQCGHLKGLFLKTGV
jgi:hypothetical protein